MWNKNNIISVASFMFFMTTSSVLSAGPVQGWGRVNMQGAIIDTACAIAVDSRYQTIDMDIVPVADIIRDGEGRTKPFSITLVDCELGRPGGKLTDWKQFQVTFDGVAEGNLFGVQGEASGVALKIFDNAGNIASPGKPLPADYIIPGTMRLDYTIKLVSNNHALKVGDYFSSIRFKLDYF